MPATADALDLDKRDPIAHKRQEFLLPDDLVYLDGNSLGPLTKFAKQRATDVIEQQWGTDLISSWNKHQWIDLPLQVGNKIATLIGANPGEVVCCDSTSINLFKLLSLVLKINSGRTKIISQKDNFPTDLYMAEGLSELVGKEQCQFESIDIEQLEHHLNDDVAALFLTQVNFRSGYVHDIKAITQLAHERGILVIWDLAHSAGVLPLELSKWQVDFAIGCGYKYLNGGPGAPAFVYAAEKYHSELNQPLSGWMGHANPFAFDEAYQPAKNIRQFLAGTPSIISMSVLDAALDIYADLDIKVIRTKSLLMTDYFASQMASRLEFQQMQTISPQQHQLRGSQLSYKHPEAYAICQAWIAAGVVADFRAPDILRIGFSPLYLRFEDLDIALDSLAVIMSEHRYLQPEFQTRKVVT